jgi:hypothetical protein
MTEEDQRAYIKRLVVRHLRDLARYEVENGRTGDLIPLRWRIDTFASLDHRFEDDNTFGAWIYFAGEGIPEPDNGYTGQRIHGQVFFEIDDTGVTRTDDYEATFDRPNDGTLLPHHSLFEDTEDDQKSLTST